MSNATLRAKMEYQSQYLFCYIADMAYEDGSHFLVKKVINLVSFCVFVVNKSGLNVLK